MSDTANTEAILKGETTEVQPVIDKLGVYETYHGLIKRYRRLCMMVAAFTIFLTTFWGMIYNLAHANILT